VRESVHLHGHATTHVFEAIPMAKDRPDGMQAPAQPRGELTSSNAEIDAFLETVRRLAPRTEPGKRGRLIFALDATMSRQPTWDQACLLQADMFRETAKIGGLDVQLVYYRGLSECRSSPWISDATRLAGLMEKIDCRGGNTQIAKVLAHARRETGKTRVQALVFVGDAMEESVDALSTTAGELGMLGVPIFVFQEGADAVVEQAFREMARLSHGAYCRFSPGSAHELGELLRAAAAYAAGGLAALEDLSQRQNAGAVRLLAQMR
jgi:hypothetical protein